MFKLIPRIFAHKSVINRGNFVLPDYILNKHNNSINLFHRFCPHRRYPLHSPGEHVDKIHCNFHNFEWSKDGDPLNNSKKILCGVATTGKSGLVFKNFIEPDHKWVNDLSNEQSLEYSHICTGSSTGSWLWLMDAEADYLHVATGHIHPRLSTHINMSDVGMDQGEDWIYQEHAAGWWSVYVFPYTFIEYKKGCLSVNYVTPVDENVEFGFSWITQFYYDSKVTPEDRIEFETLETVFKEDVAAIEMIKGKYFPLMNAMNKYEDHCVHWGQWVLKNKIK